MKLLVIVTIIAFYCDVNCELSKEPAAVEEKAAETTINVRNDDSDTSRISTEAKQIEENLPESFVNDQTTRKNAGKARNRSVRRGMKAARRLKRTSQQLPKYLRKKLSRRWIKKRGSETVEQIPDNISENSEDYRSVDISVDVDPEQNWSEDVQTNPAVGAITDGLIKTKQKWSENGSNNTDADPTTDKSNSSDVNSSVDNNVPDNIWPDDDLENREPDFIVDTYKITLEFEPTVYISNDPANNSSVNDKIPDISQSNDDANYYDSDRTSDDQNHPEQNSTADVLV